MVRRADEHRVNRLVLQQLAVVAEHRAGPAIGFFDALFGGLQADLVHVTDRDGMLHQLAEVVVALAAHADEPNANELARVLAAGRFGPIEEKVRCSEAYSNSKDRSARGSKELSA